MAKPLEPDQFVAFDLEENGQTYARLYLDALLWERLGAKATELIFYVQDWGRFRLKIPQESRRDRME